MRLVWDGNKKQPRETRMSKSYGGGDRDGLQQNSGKKQENGSHFVFRTREMEYQTEQVGCGKSDNKALSLE